LAKYLGITKTLPKQHILQIKLGKKQLQKLAKWCQKGADVAVHPHVSGNKVFLFNDTAIDKWQRKQIREGHVVEIEAK
jgi:hypothetical protein